MARGRGSDGPHEFWIDVGGTFTDCLARSPDGQIRALKVLSSGATQGRVVESPGPAQFTDPARGEDPDGFWNGYRVRLLDAAGMPLFASRVVEFHRGQGRFTTEAVLPLELPPETTYELRSDEDAPLVAIRLALGLKLDEPIPPVSVRLGTTRGTNALLTRRGAATAFVTTRGLGDLLRIGSQERPRLFDLDIVKPEPLFTRVVEIDERTAADGTPLVVPDPAAVRERLAPLRREGIESLAICLLHGYAHPAHERVVEQVARELGFAEISTSHRIAPAIKMVPRGETTVLSAYLNPVLRDYLERIARPLGMNSSRLKVMTSAGGLVDSSRFVGKDSILSGPAGGVIGFARVARAAGFKTAIGFDMGGTSTDVSRFGGEYELEYEARKAGVRVVAPMLAIETVAAGGGSLCRFDGVRLVVGPDSAGADPGPACYGRGGPLTITDMNYFVGRIPEGRFPFPLHRALVEQKLVELTAEIAGATGKRYSPEELAEGFREVANSNMVRAIRRISVARGFDPADDLLVTFGGAGAQHACALARALRMKSVLSHPLAGVLSAFGIGMADVRTFREQSVLRPYSPALLEELEREFQRLEAAARAEVLAEGIAPDRIRPAVRSLDLRYRGVDAAINVPEPADRDYARQHAELHRRQFGYVHAERPLEVVALRVQVVGETQPPEERPRVPVPRTPEPVGVSRLWHAGQRVEAAVFERAGLQPGDEFPGPAIVCEPTSTVVVDPGWTARVLARGELLLTDAAAENRGSETCAAPVASRSAAAPDPVRLEVFNNQFASIAEQMGTTLQKTSFSTNVKERLDFSCAIFDARGGLVVNAPHIPVHLGAMGETVRRTLRDHPQLAPGDVIVTNDPYRGGSHLPDVTVISPVHDPSTGEILFFTASRAHHAEIGGIVPGSMPPFSRNLAEEGVLIRSFKLVDAGASHEDALRTLLSSGPYPSRAVHDNLADVAAQVAANRSGALQLLALIERESWPVVREYMQHIQDAAETKTRRALSALPDGVYRFTDHLDDGSPICVAVTIRGDEAAIDFTGTGPVTAGNLNANRAIVTAAVMYVLRCLMKEEIPLNQGVLAPVTLTIPESLLSPPERDDPAQCAAVVGGNVEVSQRVVDVLLGALGAAAASQGTMNNLTFGDARFGYYETICGGAGATPHARGADAVHTHMTNTRLTDPEVIELRYPVRVVQFGIRRGSGGRGAHPGGDGVVRELQFLRPVQVSILSERRGPYAPFGLAGGEPGALGRNSLLRYGSTDWQALGGKVQFEAAAGDRLRMETPGGGGWGPAPC